MPLSTEVQNQITAGQCVRGSCENCCQLRDGTEASCYTIRECAPSLHFEYSLPGASPNVNIWSIGGTGGSQQLVWNGPAPIPTTRPGLVADPFDPTRLTVGVDYRTAFNSTIPPTVVGGGARGTLLVPPDARAFDADGRGLGAPVAIAFSPGLRGQIERYVAGFYGTLMISQSVFCAAYTAVTGFPCLFGAPDRTGSVKSVGDWLDALRSDQDARLNNIGVYRGNGGVIGAGGPMPGQPNRGQVTPSGATPVGPGNVALFAVIGIALLVILARR